MRRSEGDPSKSSLAPSENVRVRDKESEPGSVTVEAHARETQETARSIMREFDLIIDNIMEDVPVHEFEEAVKRLMSAVTEYSPDQSSWQAAFSARSKEAAEALKTSDRKIFYKWLEDGLSDQTSWIFKEGEAWATSQDLGRKANETAKYLEFLDLEKELAEYRIHPAIGERLDTIRAAVNQLKQEIFKTSNNRLLEVFLYEATEKNLFDFRPGGLSKLFGKGQMSGAEVFEAVLATLDPVHAAMQEGVSVKDIVQGHAADKRGWKKPSAAKPAEVLARAHKLAKEIEREIIGNLLDLESENEPNVTGAELLDRRDTLTQRALLESLGPIAGDPRFTKSISYEPKEGFDRVSDLATGYYLPDKQEVHVRSDLSGRTLAFVIAHELGHAMRPEDNLPLTEAIRWNVSAVASIAFSGHISNYAAQAPEMYASSVSKGQGTAFQFSAQFDRLREELKTRDLEEDWADSVANAMLSGDSSFVYPDKFLIVERVFEQFGLSIQEVVSEFIKKVNKINEDEDYLEAAE